MNLLIFCFVFSCLLVKIQCDSDDLLVVSVATSLTDGYKRFVHSLEKFNYKYEIYGLGEEWRGGNLKYESGGGQKINILARELHKYKDDSQKIILFSDSYDVLVTHGPETLVQAFKSLEARIVFGAEKYCWPDKLLANAYPQVDESSQSRFLNSGGFIGYASDLYALITQQDLKDNDDDQLFYTKLYLDVKVREKFKIKLDVKSQIFQNLNGAEKDIEFESVMDGDIILINRLTQTQPIVIHGNGAAKGTLNYLGNYIAKAWSSSEGCLICNEHKFSLNNTQLPRVTLALLIERPTPFLREFFEKISTLNYTKDRIDILIHNNIDYHVKEVDAFIDKFKTSYSTMKLIKPEDDSPEHEARAQALKECKLNECDYYFSVDSTAHLDNTNVLRLLIEQNRTILAPIMLRSDSSWSNFWGAVSAQGFYERSSDYLDIVAYKKVGVWNVPFISEAILIKREILDKVKIVYESVQFDAELSFAHGLREQYVFMYATNMNYFGHLINPDSFNTSLTRPEMYEIFTNPDDWDTRYIREEYYYLLRNKNSSIEQPCPDVYWFPIVTSEFCTCLIDMMETFGQWSGGKNTDPRLPGGYENVPTVDIHMNQVKWEQHWLHILKKYFLPIQQKLFLGYFHDPPQALLNFVVRYRPGEQDRLKPHHDASTYTINIALNRVNEDFVGGGCRFVRYNCSVTDMRVGWSLMHPGRLTHYHEGLTVTNGTRYIMVSFVDP